MTTAPVTRRHDGAATDQRGDRLCGHAVVRRGERRTHLGGLVLIGRMTVTVHPLSGLLDA